MNLSVYFGRFEALSVREQLLSVLTLVVVLIFATDFLLLEPLAVGAAQAQQKLDAAQRVSVSLQTRQAQGAGAQAQVERLKAEVAAAVLTLGQTERRLAQLADNLISAEQMMALLQALLDDSELQLVALENLAPETLIVAANTDAKPASGLYRHGLKIELKGTYSAATRYLQDLESQPWRFVWQSMGYEVLEYPAAVMSLEIQTLSLAPQWLAPLSLVPQLRGD
jgi:MSHA biogenesis protein MshJ